MAPGRQVDGGCREQRQSGGDGKDRGVAGKVGAEAQDVGLGEPDVGEHVVDGGQPGQAAGRGETLNLDQPGDEAQPVGGTEHDGTRQEQPQAVRRRSGGAEGKADDEHDQPDRRSDASNHRDAVGGVTRPDDTRQQCEGYGGCGKHLGRHRSDDPSEPRPFERPRAEAEARPATGGDGFG